VRSLNLSFIRFVFVETPAWREPEEGTIHKINQTPWSDSIQRETRVERETVASAALSLLEDWMAEIDSKQRWVIAQPTDD